MRPGCYYEYVRNEVRITMVRIVKIHRHSEIPPTGFATYSDRRAMPRSHRNTSYSVQNLAAEFRRPMWVNMQLPIERNSFRKSSPQRGVKIKHTAIYTYNRKKFDHQLSLAHTSLLLESAVDISRIRTYHTDSAKGTARLLR